MVVVGVVGRIDKTMSDKDEESFIFKIFDKDKLKNQTTFFLQFSLLSPKMKILRRRPSGGDQIHPVELLYIW